MKVTDESKLQEVCLALLERFQFRNIRIREGIGADGGRDIEAETIGRDESQSDYLSKWWIELKYRSKAYLNISDIEDKIRRAGNANVQYFLLVTNALVGPDTLNRLMTTALNARVQFRYWDKTTLEQHIDKFLTNSRKSDDSVEKIDILDRYKDILMLEDLITEPQQNVIIIRGAGGVGKSSLTKYILYRLRSEYCVGIIDCRLLVDLGFSLKMLAEAFGRQGYDSAFVHSENQRLLEVQRMGLLIEHCMTNEFKTLLLLDNFESLLGPDGKVENQEVLRLIRQFLDNNSFGSSLVLTSRARVADLTLSCEEKFYDRELYGWDIKFILEEFLPIADSLSTRLASIFDSEKEKEEALEIFKGNPLALKVANNLCAHHDFKAMVSLISSGSDPAKELIAAFSGKLEDEQIEVLTKLAIFNRPMTRHEMFRFVCPQEMLNHLVYVIQLVEEMDTAQHSYQLHPMTAAHFNNTNAHNYISLVTEIVKDIRNFIGSSGKSTEDIYNHSLLRQCIRMLIDISQYEEAAEILVMIGTRAVSMGDTDYLQELLKTLDGRASPRLCAMLLKVEGHVHDVKGDLKTGFDTYSKMLTAGEKLGDDWVRAAAINGLGTMARHGGQSSNAISLYEESLIIRENMKDSIGQSNSHHNLGATFLEMGDLPNAKKHLEAALRIRKRCKDDFRVSATQLYLAEYYCETGEFIKAYKNAKNCIKKKEKFKDVVGLLWVQLLLVKITLLDPEGDLKGIQPTIEYCLSTAKKISKLRDVMLSHAFSGVWYIFASSDANKAWENLREAWKTAKSLNESQFKAIRELSINLDEVEEMSVLKDEARKLVKKLKV